MPECHHCSHHLQGHLACLTCAGASDKAIGHGARFDDGRQPDILDVMAAAMRSEEPSADPTVEVAVDMFRRLLECDEDTMRLLRWRFAHPAEPLQVYATLQGVSVRTIARKIKAIAVQWPAAGRILGVSSHG